MTAATGNQLDPEAINAVKLDQGDGTTRAQGGSGDAAHVNLRKSDGTELTSLGASGLPLGSIQSEANIVYADTDEHEIVFTNLYRGIIITLQAPAAGVLPAAYAVAAFDVPNIAVGEDWTNVALVGPRFPIHQLPYKFEAAFQDLAGNPVAITNMYYRFPVVSTGYIIIVRGII